MELANIKPIQKHLLVLVKVVDAAVKSHEFKDLSTLTNKKIVGIEVHHADDVTAGPDGETLVVDAVFKKSYLKLMSCNGSEELDKIPFNALYPPNNDGRVKNFAGKVFDFGKSKIEVATPAGQTAGHYYAISFYYED